MSEESGHREFGEVPDQYDPHDVEDRIFEFETVRDLSIYVKFPSKTS